MPPRGRRPASKPEETSDEPKHSLLNADGTSWGTCPCTASEDHTIEGIETKLASSLPDDTMGLPANAMFAPHGIGLLYPDGPDDAIRMFEEHRALPAHEDAWPWGDPFQPDTWGGKTIDQSRDERETAFRARERERVVRRLAEVCAVPDEHFPGSAVTKDTTAVACPCTGGVSRLIA